jgi:hypothetical protein
VLAVIVFLIYVCRVTAMALFTNIHSQIEKPKKKEINFLDTPSE